MNVQISLPTNHHVFLLHIRLACALFIFPNIFPFPLKIIRRTHIDCMAYVRSIFQFPYKKRFVLKPSVVRSYCKRVSSTFNARKRFLQVSVSFQNLLSSVLKTAPPFIGFNQIWNCDWTKGFFEGALAVCEHCFVVVVVVISGKLADRDKHFVRISWINIGNKEIYLILVSLLYETFSF